MDEDEWCNCVGAVHDIVTDDYELESCKVQQFSLMQWTQVCNSREYCDQNAIEELEAHASCQGLVNELKKDPSNQDIHSNLICSCVQTIHLLPTCVVGNKPLIEHQ